MPFVEFDFLTCSWVRFLVVLPLPLQLKAIEKAFSQKWAKALPSASSAQLTGYKLAPPKEYDPRMSGSLGLGLSGAH